MFQFLNLGYEYIQEIYHGFIHKKKKKMMMIMTTTVMVMTMIQSIKDKISVELRPIYDRSFEKV